MFGLRSFGCICCEVNKYYITRLISGYRSYNTGALFTYANVWLATLIQHTNVFSLLNALYRRMTCMSLMNEYAGVLLYIIVYAFID